MLRVPITTPAALVATGTTVKSDANKLSYIICGIVVSLSFNFYPSAGQWKTKLPSAKEGSRELDNHVSTRLSTCWDIDVELDTYLQ